jgi:hypothetical protein
MIVRVISIEAHIDGENDGSSPNCASFYQPAQARPVGAGARTMQRKRGPAC